MAVFFSICSCLVLASRDMLKTSLRNSAFTPPTERTTASEMLKSLLGPVTVNTTSTERKTLTALSVRYSGFPGPMPTP